MPSAMSEEEVEDVTKEAEDMLEEEAARQQPSSNMSGPAEGSSSLTENEIASLKEIFPILAEFSDNFIKSTPRGDLIKIQSTAFKMKEAEKTKDADDRLAMSKAALSSRFTRVPEGKDNRWSSLHSGRFLGGAGCSTTRLWLAAREVVDKNGSPPIGCYDMGSLGMAGHVSARGWVEVHNPLSAKLSVKMFSINNCGGRAGTRSDAVSDSYANDTLDIGEFKLALRAMRLAFHFAMPWNFSIEALEGFFFLSNYCQNELGNVDKKGQLLTQFTDYVLGQNSDRWRDSEPFLTTGELKSAWAAFFHSRPQAAIAARQKKAPVQKQGGDQKSLGICFAYNMGNCAKPAGTCTTLRGKPLKHICNFTADRSKQLEVCGMEHVRKDNH